MRQSLNIFPYKGTFLQNKSLPVRGGCTKKSGKHFCSTSEDQQKNRDALMRLICDATAICNVARLKDSFCSHFWLSTQICRLQDVLWFNLWRALLLQDPYLSLWGRSRRMRSLQTQSHWQAVLTNPRAAKIHKALLLHKWLQQLEQLCTRLPRIGASFFSQFYF